MTIKILHVHDMRKMSRAKMMAAILERQKLLRESDDIEICDDVDMREGMHVRKKGAGA